MTRSQYEQELLFGLRNTPAERRAEIIEDIRCHFSEGLMAGQNEEELCAQLGSVKKLLLEYGITPPELEWDAGVKRGDFFADTGPQRSQSAYGAGFAGDSLKSGTAAGVALRAVGVIMLWLIIGIPVVATAVGLYVSLAATWLSLAVSGIICAIALLVKLLSRDLQAWEFGAIFFGGIGLEAMSILLFFPMWKLGKWLFGAIGRQVIKSIETVIGRRLNR